MENLYYPYALYSFLAFTPIIVWMFFYLRKDLHPEPKKMIMRVFILGALIACFVAIIEIIILRLVKDQYLATIFLESFLLVALVEEIAKYLVVKVYVYKSPELDEPLDIMLYMVISALGFATIENAILFFPQNKFLQQKLL